MGSRAAMSSSRLESYHGVVAMKDGTVKTVVLGEGNEPKLVVNDLLPHLGAEQNKKPLHVL